MREFRQIIVPEPIDDYTTPRVLTMDYVQGRKLTNIGAKVDFAVTRGGNNVKLGGMFNSTKLNEDFTLGLSDPDVNTPGTADFIPALRAFDLTRGGRVFHFADDGTIKDQAFYVQDDIRAGNASFMAGVRVDHYDGLVSKSLFEPRLGASFTIPGPRTVLRASYGRTLETPYNENLLLASSADAAVFGTEGVPVPPGTRDQFEGGIQQALGSWVVVDVGYFYKKTKNAYDFGVLFDTPIAFPISWDHSKLYGLTGRINLVQHGGSRRSPCSATRMRSSRRLEPAASSSRKPGVTSASITIRSSSRRQTSNISS